MVQVGSQLADYRVVADLGGGGMARVFLALRGESEIAALKVIRREHSLDKSFIEMFLDEGRIASMVRHRNVISVKGVGDSDGAYFMAMEFLHGVTLATLLKALRADQRRLTATAAATITRDAARGLHAAHESRDTQGALLGIVHRDVSLSNILIGCDGIVKVIDFGIAKAEGRLTKTATGFMKGKMRYMAPEQMRRHDVDRRADVFALGVVLWELLTGRRLYGKESDVEVARRAIDGGHPIVSDHVEVPPELDALVMRCLRVDPAERFATADAMADALSRILLDLGEEVAAPELGSLLWALAGDRLDEEAERLPISLPTRATLSKLDPPADVAIERLTLGTRLTIAPSGSDHETAITSEGTEPGGGMGSTGFTRRRVSSFGETYQPERKSETTQPGFSDPVDPVDPADPFERYDEGEGNEDLDDDTVLTAGLDNGSDDGLDNGSDEPAQPKDNDDDDDDPMRGLDESVTTSTQGANADEPDGKRTRPRGDEFTFGPPVGSSDPTDAHFRPYVVESRVPPSPDDYPAPAPEPVPELPSSKLAYGLLGAAGLVLCAIIWLLMS